MTVEEITLANFRENVLGHKGLVVVDFWADWCASCRGVGKTIDKLAKEYSWMVKFYKADIGKNPSLGTDNKIMHLPSVLFFYDGTELERTRLIGSNGYEDYQKIIDLLICKN